LLLVFLFCVFLFKNRVVGGGGGGGGEKTAIGTVSKISQEKAGLILMNDSAHFPTHVHNSYAALVLKREEPVLRQLIRTRSTRRSEPSWERSFFPVQILISHRRWETTCAISVNQIRRSVKDWEQRAPTLTRWRERLMRNVGLVFFRILFWSSTLTKRWQSHNKET